MRYLTPLTLQDRYYLQIERTILQIWEQLFYLPLLDVIGGSLHELQREIKNSASALRDAIAAGRVWYEDGQFKGEFNGRISAGIIALGGKYNVLARSYSLPRDKVPPELRIAQENANARYKAMRERMLGILDAVDIQNRDLRQIRSEYEKTIEQMELDLQGTLPAAPPFKRRDNPAVESLAIEAKLSPDQKRIIAEEWGKNLELYIKNWTDANILRLREDIQPIVLAGGRAEGLEKAIRDNYGVGARKAKFLARQETSLLMSKFQQTRYTDIGIDKYKWSTSHDSRVRPITGADPRDGDHRILNGKIFSWDNPPVTCQRTGARNHPGEDYGCRCIAIPVVD